MQEDTDILFTDQTLWYVENTIGSPKIAFHISTSRDAKFNVSRVKDIALKCIGAPKLKKEDIHVEKAKDYNRIAISGKNHETRAIDDKDIDVEN